MNKNRRLLALLTSIGLVLFLLTSSAYIILKADHECQGHGCDICVQVAHLEALLRSVIHISVLLSAIVAFFIGRHILRKAEDHLSIYANTLFGLRVRLNN